MPRSLWLGTSRSQESDADLSGVERVEGGGYGESNRDGPGSTKVCRYGIVVLFMGRIPCYRLGIYRTASRRPYIREPLRVCESPL